MLRLRVALIVSALLVCQSAIAEEEFHVFATDSQNGQILSVSVQTKPGKTTATLGKPLALSFAGTSICMHPNGTQVFVSSSRKGMSDPGAAARIDVLEGGQLKLGQTLAIDEPTGYTSIDRTGQFFLFANYRSGTIGSFRIGENSLDKICVLKTPKAEAHCILTTPNNGFVYIPCVKNNNALHQYSFDEQTGQLTPLQPHDAEPPAMFGPRHVAYHPTLPIAYFSNEQQLGVSVYEIGSDGQLTDKQHAITIPRRSPFEQGKRDLHASDLVVTPDGKQLFVAVRDFEGEEDSVFSFRVEGDGKLSLVARTKVGDIPWKLDLSPNGKQLLVSESGDERFAVFDIESNGQLTAAAIVEWNAAVRDMVVVSGGRDRI